MAETKLDLTNLPVVDTHCHPWRNEDLLALDPGTFEERITMTGMCLVTSGFGEESDVDIRPLTESTPLALTMRRRLAGYLGCEPARDWVASARRAALQENPATYVAELMANAGIEGLVYDEGYPQPTVSFDEFTTATGTTCHRVARIEPLLLESREATASYPELEDAFVARLEEAAEDERLVAFKSVIAYRTGLSVTDPSRDDCARAYKEWEQVDFAESHDAGKPIRDRLLRRTAEVARVRDRPVHIHCGGGDPEIRLQSARPQDLYGFLAEHPRQPFVLIHSGWPWVEEAAYVASVLPHIYLDVSLMLPWTSLAIDQKLEVLLGAAPTAKILYGSDEASEPEVIWLSAQIGREALGRVLGTAVERHWLDQRDAHAIGASILAGNTRRLHGLSVNP